MRIIVSTLQFAHFFHYNNQQTCRKEYLRTYFSLGITHLTQITAGEYVGVMFLFVILCQYDEGWAFIAKSLENEPNKISYERHSPNL